LQPRQAVLGKAFADVEHSRLGQPRLCGDRRVGQAARAQADHLPSMLLLCGRRQFAHVDMTHPVKLGQETAFFKTT
jgi:hypothetical protein